MHERRQSCIAFHHGVYSTNTQALRIEVTSRRRWRGAVLVAMFACASVTVAYACRERVAFVERCLRNGNQLAGCWCTFNALPDLPANYRTLATSWAHDGGVTYASQLLTLAASEVLTATTARTQLNVWRTGKAETARAWLTGAASKMGWRAARTAAPIAAAKLGPWIVAAPIVYDVGSQLLKARSVMGRHCGGTVDTFVMRVEAARLELEQIAQQASTSTLEAILEGARKMPSVVVAGGGWTWKQIRSMIGY
jgi:hypothetical protein